MEQMPIRKAFCQFLNTRDAVIYELRVNFTFLMIVLSIEPFDQPIMLDQNVAVW